MTLASWYSIVRALQGAMSRGGDIDVLESSPLPRKQITPPMTVIPVEFILDEEWCEQNC